MAVNQKAVKVLNKVLEAGFTDEKAISAMTMDDILSMQGITVRALPFSTRRVAGIPLNIILMFRTRTTDITAAAPSRYGR